MDHSAKVWVPAGYGLVVAIFLGGLGWSALLLVAPLPLGLVGAAALEVSRPILASRVGNWFLIAGLWLFTLLPAAGVVAGLGILSLTDYVFNLEINLEQFLVYLAPSLFGFAATSIVVLFRHGRRRELVLQAVLAGAFLAALGQLMVGAANESTGEFGSRIRTAAFLFLALNLLPPYRLLQSRNPRGAEGV